VIEMKGLNGNLLGDMVGGCGGGITKPLTNPFLHIMMAPVQRLNGHLSL
jgi:hypothetical protein